MAPGHRRKENKPPTPTQGLCFVQRCSVPTEFADCHVTLAYPCFKAEIKLVTQFPHALQTDTKSQAEPLFGHSLVWRTRSRRWRGWLCLSQQQSPGFPWLDDRHIFPPLHSQITPLPSEGSSADTWDKRSSQNDMSLILVTSFRWEEELRSRPGRGQGQSWGRNTDSGFPFWSSGPCCHPSRRPGTDRDSPVSHNPMSPSSDTVLCTWTQGTACGGRTKNQCPLT